MNDSTIIIEDTAVAILRAFPQPLDPNIIRSTVESIGTQYVSQLGLLDPETKELIAKKIERRFDIRMGEGAYVQDTTDYQEWLTGAKESIEDWFYWKRYRQYLETSKGFPPMVVSKGLHPVSDRVLGLLENPEKDGQWLRRGLVVGHVQSGKTANYTGVIAKAADAGYRLIVVLAGIHNNLRNQTQERIEEGFVGTDSARLLDNVKKRDKLCGVGELDSSRAPIPFTTRSQDFNAKKADQFFPMYAVTEPAIFVIKKNSNSLRNLIMWLKNSNLAGDELINLPMLLIDDEADNASIDTSADAAEATTINRLIRELLNVFQRRCYVGYTATPFANIFIDPNTEHDMYGNDLFPNDFIVSLDPPDNYVGAEKLFGNDSQDRTVQAVDDYQDLLPLKHKKDWRPEELPPSLYRAVDIFILSRAARLFREQKQRHNSMLVNVSRFTDVQSHVRALLQLYLDQAQQSISNHYALPFDEALQNGYLRSLKESWDTEFFDTGIDWEEIQSRLHASAAPIRVIEVNASRRSESPVYQDYPDGLSVIAVGGFSLSRGLTLEGLSVSYFLRNSKMYDTLMQMGRWFGYRDGYADLCRIYMPEEAISWYAHISEASEELRHEFARMQRASLTPRDFGLAVRSHPDSLIVSARNKMRTGKKVVHSISLENKLIETTVLETGEQSVSWNFRILETLVQNLLVTKQPEKAKDNFLWTDAPCEYVREFVQSFQNHEEALKTQSSPVAKYLDHLIVKGIDHCDVVLVSVAKAKGSPETTFTTNDLPVGMAERTSEFDPSTSGLRVSCGSARVGEREDESYGLSDSKLEEVASKWQGSGGGKKSIPGYCYREARDKPILLVRVVKPKYKKSSNGSPSAEFPSVVLERGIVAYSLSFPPARSEEGIARVDYVVNTVWWNEKFGSEVVDEDEEENE